MNTAMDSRKPLTAGEIEEINALAGNHYTTWESNDKEAAATYLARLLSLLTPPTDAAVHEAVVRLREDARTGEIHHGDGMFPVLNPQRWSTCLSADLYILLRAVQAPRLTPEQREAVKEAKEVFAISGDVKLANRLGAAFPEAFAGEVGE